MLSLGSKLVRLAGGGLVSPLMTSLFIYTVFSNRIVFFSRSNQPEQYFDLFFSPTEQDIQILEPSTASSWSMYTDTTEYFPFKFYTERERDKCVAGLSWTKCRNICELASCFCQRISFERNVEPVRVYFVSQSQETASFHSQHKDADARARA